MRTVESSLAEESGHPRLPGLRWAELKQIETCLTRQGFGDFEVKAIIPLLYPVVESIAFDELEDVRQTLATAWQELQVLDATQTDQWLDETITVYDKGQELRLDTHKEWKSAFKEFRSHPEHLWAQAGEEGWKSTNFTSERHTQKDSWQFLPFFSMLKRCC